VTACAAGVEKLDIKDAYSAPSGRDAKSIAKYIDMTLAELKRVLSRYWACFK
jgi:hypothetical protein